MSWWEFWKKTGQKADFVQSFLDLNSEPMPQFRSIDQLSFVVLDTETSGFEVANDHVLSFGAVKIQELKIKVFQSIELFPNTQKPPNQTVKIHGILDQPERISLQAFSQAALEFMGNGILVGHHVGFDLEMLLRIFRDFGLEKIPNPVLDTMNLAIRLDHGPLADINQINRENYSLDSLCLRFGIEMDDRHTAAGDAFLTAQLLINLLAIAKKKGITTAAKLLR